ncbi:MAG TPA: recombinase family protein [Myxococcota bacterium]|nr:recombinase family protein [Myxococcota bacterium]
MPRRVAFYARVSTAEQHVEPQLHALRGYSEARGLTIAEEFIDNGVSGAKDRRPALDRLLAAARRRRFDVLACTKLDRLARSVHHLTSLGRELEALGIDLVVLDQSIDTSTPAGRLLFHVLGSIAEFERDLIRERTAAGMRAAKRRGAKIGRPRAAVDRVALVQGIREGTSVSALARRLGVSRPTIRKLVSTEVARLGVAPRRQARQHGRRTSADFPKTYV